MVKINMENDADSTSQSSCHKWLYQYVAVFTGILAATCSGMHAGWSSPCLPILLNKNSTIPTSHSDGSWLITIFFMAEPLGCLAGFLLVNRIGRKACILISSPIFFISWLIIAFAPNVLMLECARALAGCGTGITFSVLPIYVSEIANKQIRGFLSCSITVALKLGILGINVIGVYFDIRTSALIAAFIPVLHFLTFFWMPDSPYFYILRRNPAKAAVSLKIFNRTQNVDTEVSVLNTVIGMNFKRALNYRDLFAKKANRKALVIIIGIKSLQHLSGFYAIGSYGLTIFNEVGGAITGSTATIIYFSIQLLTAAIGCTLVDRVGRKPLLIISITGVSCSLVVEAIYFYLKQKTNLDISSVVFLPLASLLLYTSSYSIGLNIIPLLILGELFPVDIKAFAVGFGLSWFAVLASVVLKLFQIINDTYGMYMSFFIFALCSAVGLIFIIYCVPETKGKSLEEIQLNLLNSTSKEERRNDIKGNTHNLTLLLPLNIVD